MLDWTNFVLYAPAHQRLNVSICDALCMFIFAYIARFRALLLARDIKFPAADDEQVSYVCTHWHV